MDEILDFGVARVGGNEEVAGLLANPGGVGAGRATGDPDGAGLVMNEEQDVEGDQSAGRPDLLGEEIRGPGHVEMARDERFPVHAFAIR